MTAINVHVELDGDTVDVGYAMLTPRGGLGVETRFAYDREYLARPNAYPIDPQLTLDDAPHVFSGVPLAILDASPDAWGRMLLDEDERQRALDANEDPRPLTDADYLFGVSDLTRQGALRFTRSGEETFQSTSGAVPRLIELADLLSAADKAADQHDWDAIKQLLEAGSGALGGARAKAAVIDDGDLWIAKFPMTNDTTDVPLWEMTALDVAEQAGLDVPDRRLIDVGGRKVLLIRRFDRSAGHRVGYISARTMLGAKDPGARRDYRELAEVLRTYSNHVVRDLEMLWRQAAVSAFMNNTDNHLRNYGFIRDNNGWSLSPVFDLDPNPKDAVLFHTPICHASYRSGAVSGLTRLAESCGISPARTSTLFQEAYQSFRDWRTIATSHGAKNDEISAFQSVLPKIYPDIEAAIEVAR